MVVPSKTVCRSADCDVVIVGAGAAGIAAGQTLSSAGYSVKLLEARRRIGGRAWTDRERFGVPVDLGCQWLHSADINPLTRLAEELGFNVIRRNPSWGPLNARNLLSNEDFTECAAAFDWFFKTTECFPPDAPDAPVSSVFPDNWRWQPMLRAVVTFMSGAEPEELSLRDYANYLNTNQNWPLRQGYGALIERLGRDLPVMLNAPVIRIDWSGNAVVVDSAGGRLRARTVILTVPTSVLATGRIVFNPPLPGSKTEAIENLPLGANNKVLLAIDGNPFGVSADTFVVSSIETSRVSSLQVFPFGRPLVSAFLGGALARELERGGEAAARQFVIEELVQIFGEATRKHVGGSLVTAWGLDPWSCGAYSYAPPGQAACRPALAVPLADKLFFAGEATSVEFYSTAHGAYLSGQRAAAEAMQSLPCRSD